MEIWLADVGTVMIMVAVAIAPRGWLTPAITAIMTRVRYRLTVPVSSTGNWSPGWQTPGTIMVGVVPRSQRDGTMWLVPHSSTTLSPRLNDLC
jgi:hypothetical protein